MAAVKVNDTIIGEVTESTSLLSSDKERTPAWRAFFSPLRRVLLCGFLVSLSFSVTQVPLLYLFRQMTCSAYYKSHPLPGRSTTDPCSIPQIAAGTARSISLLSFSTTFFGAANLILTGWTIKRLGVKYALAIQVFWPAVRLLVQNVGVEVGSGDGIIIIQCSQIITIVGGPVGYMLALNTFVTELAPHEERTGALGRLQGYCVLGSSVGSLMGGLLSDAFGIASPFRITLGLFLLSTAYVLVCLPYTPPEVKGGGNGTGSSQNNSTGVARFFGPLRTFAPQKWTLPDGRTRLEYGALVLAIGVFLGVLATGYIPTLLQMYATDIFGFGTTENSYLVSMHLLLRGLFLMYAFPKIIAAGRHYHQQSEICAKSTSESDIRSPPRTPLPAKLPAASVAEGPDVPLEDAPLPKSISKHDTFEFDLYFTRFSLLIDGILTGFASLVSSGWQMYLVSALLPLGAGTASAAKGTILQMCAPNERTDALSGMALVEMIARLSNSTWCDNVRH